MTEEQLKNLLFKVSVLALHSMSGSTTDPITVQEAIERNSYARPILGSVQIMSVINISDSEKEITFTLSPDYLLENQMLVFEGCLTDLTWTYKLPQYDYGNEDILMEDAEGQISMRSEEGLVEWLIRGSIDLVKVNEQIYKLDLVTFYQSMMYTNE